MDTAGNLVCCWFAGSWEGHPDNAIWCRRQVDGVWASPEELFKVDERQAHWNPVLFRAPAGHLILFFKVGPSPMDWRTLSAVYANGKWSSPSVFGGYGGRGPVRSKPIVLANGFWVAPASHEIPRYLHRFSRPVLEWTSFVDRSESAGQSWAASDLIRAPQGVGLIQPTLWESEEGLHMLMRSNAGRIFRSDSTDHGVTWAEATPVDLPNPNSAIDVAQVSHGLIALAYNHAGGNWVQRSPMSIAFSRDDGKTWSKRVDVEGGSGNFSYPTLLVRKDRLYMSYSSNRHSIQMVEYRWSLDGNQLLLLRDGKKETVVLP